MPTNRTISTLNTEATRESSTGPAPTVVHRPLETKKKLTKRQLEILREMANGAQLIQWHGWPSRSGMGHYSIKDRGGIVPIGWKTFCSIISVQRNPRLVEDGEVKVGWREFNISEAGRVVAKSNRD